MRSSLNFNSNIGASPLSVIAVWAYVFVLFWSLNVLSAKWSYVGINFYFPDLGRIIFTGVLSVMPLFVIPKRLKLPSDYVHMYLYVFTFIPSVSVPLALISHDTFNENFYVFCVVFLLCMIYLIKRNGLRQSIVSKLRPISFKFIPFITLAIYGFSIILFVGTFGLSFSVPDLSDVYDIRAQYKEITQGNLITRYFVGWMGYVVNVLLLLYGMSKKNIPLIALSFIFQLYVFSLMALKSHIATYFLAAVLFFWFKKFRTLSSIKFVVIVVTFIVSLSFVDYVFSGDLFQMLITRRIMIVPSQLMYYHFDFFETNSKTWWGFSIFKGFVEYPYSLPPPNLIGEKHFGNPNLTAVVNLFIEGYTAFGYVGMFFATFILKALLNGIDHIYVKRSKENVVILVLVLGLCNILNSTSVLTMLVSHGWLLLLFIISVFPWSTFRISENRLRTPSQVVQHTG